jgi:hypothetical protein
MNSALFQLARQRQEELCRKVEFQQRHGPPQMATDAASRPSRVRARVGFLLVGAGNRLLIGSSTAR